MAFVHNVKQHLKAALRLPLPDRLLKYFPPSFTVRDPVLSLVSGARRKNKRCALILVKLEGALPILETVSTEWFRTLQQAVQHTMITVLPLFFRESDMIGAKHWHDEFLLFVQLSDSVQQDSLLKTTRQFRLELEHRIGSLYAADGAWNGRIRLVAGCMLLSPDIPDTETAVSTAYQYASSAASGRLPEDYGATRLQLIALTRDENIRVLAQPIMNLENGEVSGWEFLTRGPRDTPFHSPGDLFEYAHQAGLLPRLEQLVFKKVFQELTRRALKETVFLNITAVSLGQRAFLDALLLTLEQYPAVRPGQIVLEITERYKVQDYDHLSGLVREYRALGFRFAVDDAGTGFSSLQSISEIIPDMIKIDRSLIRDIDTVAVKQVMLRTILYMAEHINCQVIAEGVERQEEAHVLFKHRVGMGQGYYFAKPAPLQHDSEQLHLQRLKEKIMTQRQVSSA
ncbi:EAL domain-containing protein [Paenibacillus oceani]|uniref:EAL domain-containing protein n=1 Tax=Paenibacillus oceani TaxID=2772510 RepID=A0A927CF45_9BACL|nr:EAL domain-containing protein [Paenibacillus oceani]MBD2865782.1 EAL domain-containing protein [Paenibacillus oceani]